MKRIAFLLLALPVFVLAKDSWKSGTIKVLDTDEWCSRPGIPDWPGVCGPPRSDQRTFINDADGSHPANPRSQLLEIDATDTIYIVRRTTFDSGLQFRPGATAQFSVDGKHLTIKFDHELSGGRVRHEQGRTDILQVKKP